MERNLFFKTSSGRLRRIASGKVLAPLSEKGLAMPCRNLEAASHPLCSASSIIGRSQSNADHLGDWHEHVFHGEQCVPTYLRG